MALPSFGQIAGQGAKDTYKAAIADPTTNFKNAAMAPITRFTKPVSSFLQRAAGNTPEDRAVEAMVGDATPKSAPPLLGGAQKLLGRIAKATERTAKAIESLVDIENKRSQLSAQATKRAAREGGEDDGQPTGDEADATKKVGEANKMAKMDMFGKLLIVGSVIKGIIENLETPLGEFKATFSTIAMGLTGIAALVLPKMIKAFKALRAAYIAFTSFSIKEFVGNQIKTLKSIIGTAWKLIKAPFVLLKKIYDAYKVFIAKEFVQNQITTLKTIMSSAWAKLAKPLKLLRLAFAGFTVFFLTTFIPGMISAISGMVAALAPALIAAAPFIAGALMLAAQFYVMKKMLDKVTEALGFESIGQTLMFGVMKLKDGLAAVANFFIGIYNKILGFVKSAVKKLGRFAPDSLVEFANSNKGELKELATNNAEKYYQANSSKAEGKDAKPSTGSNLLDKMSEQNARALEKDRSDSTVLKQAAADAGIEVKPGMSIAGRVVDGKAVDLMVDGEKINIAPKPSKVAPTTGTAVHQFAGEDRPGPVTIINNIDQSQDVKSGVQNISNNPMGTGAPAGI